MGTHVDGCAASACPFPCPWRVQPQGSGPVNDAPRTCAGAYCTLRHCSLRVPLSPLPPFAPAPPLPKYPPASAYCTLRRWILRARALATLATARSGGRWVRRLLHAPLRAPALATLATARSGGRWVRRLLRAPLRAPALATMDTACSGAGYAGYCALGRWLRWLLHAPAGAGYAGYCALRCWLRRIMHAALATLAIASTGGGYCALLCWLMHASSAPSHASIRPGADLLRLCGRQMHAPAPPIECCNQ
ncbi:hypothetical protein BJ912DRAFT_925021 [Pholiota molesta]|nr:hypothetical protein BJ912DRAFT_925021 [Pholiota molesta]